MFKPTSASTIQEYLRSLSFERHSEMELIDAFIRRTVPSLKPYFARNMIGYGTFPCTNYKRELIEWPVVALASQKHSMSIYVCSVVNGEYVAEKHRKDLGNVKVGKSCISFKKTDDLDLAVLRKVLTIAEKKPGLVSKAGTSRED